jgi:hypothetical protein
MIHKGIKFLLGKGLFWVFVTKNMNYLHYIHIHGLYTWKFVKKVRYSWEYPGITVGPPQVIYTLVLASSWSSGRASCVIATNTRQTKQVSAFLPSSDTRRGSLHLYIATCEEIDAIRVNCCWVGRQVLVYHSNRRLQFRINWLVRASSRRWLNGFVKLNIVSLSKKNSNRIIIFLSIFLTPFQILH